MSNNNLDFELMARIIKEPRLRKEAARRNHMMFFAIYFPHYLKYPTAPFQKRIFALSEDEKIKILEIMAFRYSAKSTIMNFSYPVWAIVGTQQKKFVVIMSQTRDQARQHLVNIKKELESNDLLKSDLGPFEVQDDQWGACALSLPWYDAKIMAISVGQTIRGLRHKQYRPDLIICDDIEDLASVKTQENRDKTYKILTGEVFPAGEKNTRLVILGNALHEDSALMRIRSGIKNGLLNGYCLFVPLISEENKIAWPGRYPDMKSIEEEKRNIGNEIDWQREYMLKILPAEGQVIHLDWIKYYNEIESDQKDYRHTLTGIDPAASENDHACYTAAVSARIYGYGKDMKIYILPNPLNKRLPFPDAVKALEQIYRTRDNGSIRRMLVEGFSYQIVLAQRLREVGIPAEKVTPYGQDKRSRLILTSQLIFDGVIKFPEKGAEELINQIVNFGSEPYNDLADAFTLLVNKALDEMKKPATPEVFIVSSKRDDD